MKQLTHSTPAEALSMVEEALARAGEEGATVEVKQHVTRTEVIVDVAHLDKITRDTRDMVHSAAQYAQKFVPGAQFGKRELWERLTLPGVRYVRDGSAQRLVMG